MLENETGICETDISAEYNAIHSMESPNSFQCTSMDWRITIVILLYVQSGHLFTCMTPWVMPLHELVHVTACWESMYLHAE